MAYKVDKPEVNSDNKRLEQWANMTSDELVFALNDLERKIIELKKEEPTESTSNSNAEIADILELLATKVDKVQGKGLSTNDYTDNDKNKLSGIEENAEENVQSDWNQSDNTSDDFIKNKPNIPSGTYFGTSTGQAALQNKAVVVSSDQNFELKVGCIVAVKFDAINTYSATASAPITMNVNNTGAKQIWYASTGTPTGTNSVAFGHKDYVMRYMYDGTYWVWAGFSAENNTTYSAMSVNELTTGTATNLRTVRADYLKTAINNLINTKLQGISINNDGDLIITI